MKNVLYGSFPWSTGSSQGAGTTFHCQISLAFLILGHFHVVVSSSVMSDSLRPYGRGSSVHGISQAGILEWVAISASRGSSQSGGQTCISCIGRRILYRCASREARRFTYLSFVTLTFEESSVSTQPPNTQLFPCT